MNEEEQLNFTTIIILIYMCALPLELKSKQLWAELGTHMGEITFQLIIRMVYVDEDFYSCYHGIDFRSFIMQGKSVIIAPD